jgi:hypothetical protein
MRRNITPLKTQKTNRCHAHLRGGLQYHSLQAQIFCCWTVRLHRKGMPKDLKPKTLTLKHGDIRVRTRGDLTAVVWKDKRLVGLLTNMHDPPKDGNFHDVHRNAVKLAIVAD